MVKTILIKGRKVRVRPLKIGERVRVGEDIVVRRGDAYLTRVHGYAHSAHDCEFYRPLASKPRAAKAVKREQGVRAWALFDSDHSIAYVRLCPPMPQDAHKYSAGRFISYRKKK